MVNLTRCPARHQHPQTALWVVHVRSDDGPVAPRGGDGAVRTTGATDAQIEAAARRRAESEGLPYCDPIVAENACFYVSAYRRHADFLVTTDHRIVRVDDLRALAHVLELFAPEYTTNEQAAIDRIQALIGEAE